MKILSQKPALLLVIFGSLGILFLATRQMDQQVDIQPKFQIQAVSITEKQSKEILN